MIQLTYSFLHSYTCSYSYYLCLAKLYYYACVILDNTSNGNDSNSDLAALIAGAVGGFILLLMIIVVFLCIVILCMIKLHRKESKEVPCNAAQLNTDVTMENNPSYDVTQVNSVTNPIHLDIPITANPSYSVPTRPYSKISEDTYNYVPPNEFIQHPGLDRPVEMETNPSYEVCIGKEKSTALSTTSDTRTYQSHDATAMEYDDVYVSSDHVLHHTSNVTDGKKDNHVDKSHNAKTSQSYYFALVTNSTEPTGGGNKENH